MPSFDKDYSLETATTIANLMEEDWAYDEATYAIEDTGLNRGAGIREPEDGSDNTMYGAAMVDGFTMDPAVEQEAMTLTMKATVCFRNDAFHVSYSRWGFFVQDPSSDDVAGFAFQTMNNTNSPYYGGIHGKWYMFGTGCSSETLWGYYDLTDISSPYHLDAFDWTYEEPAGSWEYQFWFEVTIELTILLNSAGDTCQLKPKFTMYNKLDGETTIIDDIDAVVSSDNITMLWAQGLEVKFFAAVRNSMYFRSAVYVRRLSIT
jgi:hypothetical protein